MNGRKQRRMHTSAREHHAKKKSKLFKPKVTTSVTVPKTVVEF
jgi:hypothetical protein